MPGIRTIVTELVTGLGTLGYDTLQDALAARPVEMVSIAPEQWSQLEQAHRGGALELQFRASFTNGRCMLDARDGLRGRVPTTVEWKGNQKNPGDDAVPADLRIDHVYLISCKYDSRMLHNVAPARLFHGNLRRGDRRTSRDWFHEVAGEAHTQLYKATLECCNARDLPASPVELTSAQREALKATYPARWPEDVATRYRAMCEIVAIESARRWRAASAGKQDQEELLWRLLRFGSAPYFVLGYSPSGPMRLRIATPWDWRQHYLFKSLDIQPVTAGQPQVSWEATVRDRHSGVDVAVGGFVEIRWSHGRFGGLPEAKVHLTTPHAEVPGYFTLDS